MVKGRRSLCGGGDFVRKWMREGRVIGVLHMGELPCMCHEHTMVYHVLCSDLPLGQALQVRPGPHQSRDTPLYHACQVCIIN